jgi:uncharacterized membrane protein
MLGYDWPRLHAALNDLPAALLLTAVLFDLVAAATRKPSFRQAGLYTLIVGALGAGAAVLSGLQAEESIEHGTAVHRVMETHEQLGLITLGIFGLLALWRLVRERRMGTAERSLALALALGGAGVLVAAAVYGGRLVFDHAAGIPSGVLQAEAEERTAGHEHAPGEEHETPATISPPGDPSAGSAGDAPAGHVDPPGTPPHTHEKPAEPAGHNHAPGTPSHEH